MYLHCFINIKCFCCLQPVHFYKFTCDLFYLFCLLIYINVLHHATQINNNCEASLETMKINNANLSLCVLVYFIDKVQTQHLFVMNILQNKTHLLGTNTGKLKSASGHNIGFLANTRLNNETICIEQY